ncbi:Leucine-rich repeat-containing protein typical subtype OS=Herpetosiphon aurantiacus (strain ATCC 23779 / DSM 785) GN=Haur_4051 PE=4 SV=1: LRR_6 [Gemmataceae bacterium]|nr:Leucine-rich repeat-containing protein typical subtype OS=Herpetosiphon aurantiacus (strain ATCC 23779 / DSM 785) GN=Haur_4051 PE=4 SV=1: LRR_6 [Gemmataceae bacterium]VTU00639.1 Leucine-rich repeat-containing protein typical subtype OS=Herpetosiphon aurantiacus (strain ATCC 23779 / DSM 785) GN=Haur_4051 PE=4 SV=1: LRR_6 [Gemmataceae bacterium]
MTRARVPLPDADGVALYRAVIADPADDTPRLVYADWLEEHDRGEEAEFIRLGCRLDAAAPDHPEFVEWRVRHAQLALWLAAHAPGPELKFKAGLQVSGGAEWWRFTRRGFPSFLEFDGNRHAGLKPVRDLAASLERALGEVPVRWLAVRHLTNDQLRELLRQPVLARLDRLTVQLYSVGAPNDEAAQLLADCKHLTNLRGLVAAFPFGDAGAAALAGSEHLARLEYLNARCDGLTPAGARSLGSGAWRSALRVIRAEGLLLGAFEALCGAGPFPGLHTLDMTDCVVRLPEWEAFARSAAFPSLSCLKLERINLSGGLAERLLGAPWFRPAHLSLNGCALMSHGARALAAAPWLGGLRSLCVRVNVLGPADVALLARSPGLTGLKHLDLSNNELGAAGLKALAKNPALRGLIELDLAGYSLHTSDRVTPQHFEEFLTRLDLPHLRALSLSGRPIGPTAARALAADKFASLTRLDLGACRVTDPAVRALLESPALHNLVELRLNSNSLKTGPEPLVSRRVLPRLGSCSLENNRIPPELAKRLKRRPGVVV